MNITSITSGSDTEIITKKDLAKRWDVSLTCIENNIKNNNIRCAYDSVTMFEVKRHEDKLKANPSLPYSAFNKYVNNRNVSTNPTVVSDFLGQQTQFISSWIAGKARIQKRYVIKVLEHFIGVDEEAMYNYLVETL